MLTNRRSVAPPHGARAGHTLVEVACTVVILTTVLLASASAFSASLSTADRSRRLGEGAIFLESVMENLAAQPYEDLLALDGNQIFDGDTLATSELTVDLSVFLAEVDLIQIEAVLTDRTAQVPITRLTAQRTRR